MNTNHHNPDDTSGIVNDHMKEENTKSPSKFSIRLPIYLAIGLTIGFLFGMSSFNTKNDSSNPEFSFLKLRTIIHLIDQQYVDTVDTDKLVEGAINNMLEELDPHSVYIPARDKQMASTALESDFEGVGIQFEIIKDTLYVVDPITGGPSEKVGIQVGDKIIEIDGENIAGIGLTNKMVFKYLRGPKGTKVNVKVKRKFAREDLEFTIVRDKIPTHSADINYMIDDEIGYIKVSRFAQKTDVEFRNALIKLKEQGMKKLMIDLRYNSGGYLNVAIKMVDEMLSGNKMIVYTDGKVPEYDSEERAGRPGLWEEGPVIVLINEGSASASEILSGALQDNDRGLIVGRRSFGKGLVQRPIPLGDGSELRLTISRYYTPSGRSIQKDYSGGKDEYSQDYLNRIKHGELYSADSINFDESLQFKTAGGRTVYGGGGIMPDYFIPLDSSFNYSYYNKHGAILRAYSLEYYNQVKRKLKRMDFTEFKDKFEVDEEVIKDIRKLADEEKIEYDEEKFNEALPHFKKQLKVLLARTHWGINESYQILNEDDKIILEALKLYGEAEKIEKGKF